MRRVLIEELAPAGALQTVLARRGRGRRLAARAGRSVGRRNRVGAPFPQPGGQQIELFAERTWGPGANSGLALIRDGNGTRSFETLLRYRGAAMAEFSRALRMLKALQAEQAADQAATRVLEPVRVGAQPTPRPRAPGPLPDQPERGATRRLADAMPARPVCAGALHEPPAPWLPNQPAPALLESSGGKTKRIRETPQKQGIDVAVARQLAS